MALLAKHVKHGGVSREVDVVYGFGQITASVELGKTVGNLLIARHLVWPAHLDWRLGALDVTSVVAVAFEVFR